MDGCSLRSSASDRVYYFYYIFIIHVQRPGTNVFPSRPESFPSGGGGGPGQPGAPPGRGGKSISGVNTNKSTVAKPCVRRVLSAEFIASAGARSPGWAVAGAAPLPTLRARLGQRFERGSLVGESSRRLWRSGEGRGLCGVPRAPAGAAGAARERVWVERWERLPALPGPGLPPGEGPGRRGHPSPAALPAGGTGKGSGGAAGQGQGWRSPRRPFPGQGRAWRWRLLRAPLRLCGSPQPGLGVEPYPASPPRLLPAVWVSHGGNLRSLCLLSLGAAPPRGRGPAGAGAAGALRVRPQSGGTRGNGGPLTRLNPSETCTGWKTSLCPSGISAC